MIEFVLLAQLATSEPPPVTPSQPYQAPKWQQPKTTMPSSGSVPSSKDIEEFEQEIHNHPG
jgi:hypothetical protein